MKDLLALQWPAKRLPLPSVSLLVSLLNLQICRAVLDRGQLLVAAERVFTLNPLYLISSQSVLLRSAQAIPCMLQVLLSLRNRASLAIAVITFASFGFARIQLVNNQIKRSCQFLLIRWPLNKGLTLSFAIANGCFEICTAGISN